ncbi:NF038129 family PEP-CTERM protein [Duganella levis]|uniref:PEP-CTERM sorting domain-containing protein n=1 Tax=Duganella levis TaxID=2692169 RepID=A0ABW9VXI5_9BURK|nr:NF038129 family PEP-CTERM protein [Duganella levis]MYN26279.1 PEP-CTERM sorting domain-containing protein [Duganella levis]
MSILNKLSARLLFALMLACGMAQASAESYHVSIDTSTLAEQEGYVDFLFLGLANADPVQARLSNFAGDFTSSSFAQGQVAGSLASQLTIGNGDAWNEFAQWARLGGMLSFDVSFSQPMGSGSAGATLSVALLDAGLNYLGASGDIATFALLPAAVTAVSTDAAYATVSNVSAVPEPAAYLMLAAGLLLMAGLRNRRRL